ncbi:hypothetical protein C0U44_31245, partial [Klebsiella pneumoniae]
RNARAAALVGEAPNMIVCWGGHSINENEYLYARRARYAAGPAGTEYRNARAAALVGEAPNMIVCWGGHSINENEYLYAR